MRTSFPEPISKPYRKKTRKHHDWSTHLVKSFILVHHRRASHRGRAIATPRKREQRERCAAQNKKRKIKKCWGFGAAVPAKRDERGARFDVRARAHKTKDWQFKQVENWLSRLRAKAKRYIAKPKHDDLSFTSCVNKNERKRDVGSESNKSTWFDASHERENNQWEIIHISGYTQTFLGKIKATREIINSCYVECSRLPMERIAYL